MARWLGDEQCSGERLIMGVVSSLKRPLRPIKRRWVRARKRRELGSLAPFVAQSELIAGWARGDEAAELARVASSLPDGSTIVEIGSFLGSSAVLLAGGRRVAGSGVVHCVDPFDGSGDQPSVPVYREITDRLIGSIRMQFESNLQGAGLLKYVVVHEGTAEEIGETWSAPIDMLFLDGDQSVAGARLAFEIWAPFVKAGGIIAAHNSADRSYLCDHDGHRRVAVECLVGPAYSDVRCVGTTTFAKKV